MKLLLRSSGSVLAVLGVLLAAVPATSAAAATTSQNLIVNGNAEAGYCTKDWGAASTVPGWTVESGSPNVMCYTPDEFRLPSGSAPGTAFFAPGNQGDGAMTQTVDVSSAARAIDNGGVSYDLRGWLGGWTGYWGHVTVSLHFQGADGTELDSADLPTVTSSDRESTTEFLQRSTTGDVPAGTRAIQVQVQFQQTGHETGYLDNLSLTLDTPVKAKKLTPPASKVPGYDHVFTVMMENTDYSQIMNDPDDTPYIHGLMDQGALMTNYHAVYHPSDENYLAVSGGDTYTSGATYWPNINSPQRNLGDTVEAAHKTWKAYEQGMGTPCNTSKDNDGEYMPDDAPFINYTDISDDPDRCAAHLFDTSQLATDLQSADTTPNFSWIAADDYNDGEGSGNGSSKSLQTQDNWLRDTLEPILSSPAWTDQKSLLILTWDESQNEAANHVATIVVGSQGTVQPGTSSTARYDHYSTARTIEAALHLPGLTANDTYATPLNDAFDPPVTTDPAPLSSSTPTVSDGGSITIDYTIPLTADVSSTNWIGIYPAGADATQRSWLTWQYAPNANGALTFGTGSLKGPGDYDVYLLANDGYTVISGPYRITVN
ncbi:alkaline phosphatase family protein [Kitasatospora viridis]|uniref:Phosphoesterase family protein n=1 Tax=Kitasatospora viridis TaxID=281105 RepID=A0A561TSM0_9ACTN|nr:alkaline phosphatase family protein [Kitasatospora viridis]TWF90101.1 phosphoesterase family protein [Kitasatospora viridis]